MTNLDQSNEQSGKKYWRSLEELANSPELEKTLKAEFPRGAAELEITPGVGRRKFLGVVGASMALAGVNLTGCIRKPRESILPYTRRPEDLVPGRPMYFATSAYIGSSVMGLLATSTEGRPTKLDGNPSHPQSLGSSNAWAQASLLELYNPDRSRIPAKAGGENSNWEEFRSFFEPLSASLKSAGGKGLALIVDSTPSPTLSFLLKEIRAAYPQAKLYLDDPLFAQNAADGLKMLGLGAANLYYSLDKADVIASFDADFLGTGENSVVYSRMFADRRRILTENSTMNRLYALEPAYTITGMAADHHLRLQGSQIGEALLALAGELAKQGLAIAPEISAKVGNASAALSPAGQKLVVTLAQDLLRSKGKSAIFVGPRQPAWVHAVAYAMNSALGNVGAVVRAHTSEDYLESGDLVALAAALKSGEVQTLVSVGTNPVYNAPADLGMAELIKGVATSVQLSYYKDETAKVAKWHVPMSHFLEAWGDLRSTDGTVSIQQPLIAPLFDTISPLEFLATLLTGKSSQKGAYEVVKGYWAKKSAGSSFEKDWNRWLHDGVISNTTSSGVGSTAPTLAGLAAALNTLKPALPASKDALEISFSIDNSVADGRYANNGWLQEVPDTLSKLTWDNAAIMSQKTANDLGIGMGDLIELSHEDRKLVIAAFVSPGIADYTITIPLGYGRTFGGLVATDAGFNANLLRGSAEPHFATGAKFSGKKGTYALASSQTHSLIDLEARPIVREATLEEFRKNPKFVELKELMPRPKQKTLLWDEPNPTGGYQWGMSIDLNSCTGCNACTVACQAENNIPIVGKERVLNGREMAWIRLDRYFTGTTDDPQTVLQPMMCVHCENAPCESVCPVAATVHSPEGLNDMVYNRCIGTRYCANNCPYKVRRFNFFAFGKENAEANPLLSMQQNPNVTVRFRGVMEKCTYCVQRINRGKIDAKVAGKDKVVDGAIVTACEQVCPTKAIVFGDLNDPESAVSKLKSLSRDFTVLGELNTQPRTTYLAKLRNPNPDLA
jgi:MoCo/4Fe-4S cofactor protein with predicted Tat translocation signal